MRCESLWTRQERLHCVHFCDIFSEPSSTMGLNYYFHKSSCSHLRNFQISCSHLRGLFTMHWVQIGMWYHVHNRRYSHHTDTYIRFHCKKIFFWSISSVFQQRIHLTFNSFSGLCYKLSLSSICIITHAMMYSFLVHKTNTVGSQWLQEMTGFYTNIVNCTISKGRRSI